MTLSLPGFRPRIGSIGALGLALVWTTLSFGAAVAPSPAMAQTQGKPFYRVQLAQPATETRAIAGNVVWACQGATCVAGKGTSRPLRVCRELNRKFGEVASFTAKGQELPAEDLARCNA